MTWHWPMGAFLGFAGCIGLIACTLDQSGISILLDGSSEGSGGQAGSGSQGSGSAQASSGSQGAGGAASSSGAGQGGGSSSSTTGGQGGGSTCGTTPPSLQTIFNCDLQNECNAPINCPMGADCIVQCTGNASCKGTVINCAHDHLCRIVCNAPESCEGAIFVCGVNGVCDLQCGNQAQACANTLLICSAQKCTASCSGNTKPMVQCSNSCMCTICM